MPKQSKLEIAQNYFFTKSAVLESKDSLQKLYQEEDKVIDNILQTPLLSFEKEIIDEQRRIQFTHDSFMQDLFENSFESYSRAMDDPNYLEQILAKHQEDINIELEKSNNEQTFVVSSSVAWEDHEDELVDDEVDSDFQEDPLYQQAYDWSLKLHSYCNQNYFEQSKKERDLFRVLVNVIVVPAKIAFACVDHDQINESTCLENSIDGYKVSLIFLKQVIDSMERLCLNQNAGAEIFDFLATGEKLQQVINLRIADTEKRIHSLGGWEYFAKNHC